MPQHLRSVTLLGGVGGLRDFCHRLAVVDPRSRSVSRSCSSSTLNRSRSIVGASSCHTCWTLTESTLRVWSYRAGVTGDGVLIAGHEIAVDVRVDDVMGGL